MPTLAIVGGKSPAWFHNGMRALANALPNARFCVFEGQTHMVKPKAQAPLLVGFFETAADPPNPSAAPRASCPCLWRRSAGVIAERHGMQQPSQAKPAGMRAHLRWLRPGRSLTAAGVLIRRAPACRS